MNSSYPAITTLIRNKLNALPLEESTSFLAQKGIDLQMEDVDLFSLYPTFQTSEITQAVASGLIFRGAEVVCNRGIAPTHFTLEKSKTFEGFSWTDKTVFIECMKGQRVYMYWDPKYNDWAFADDKSPKTLYGDLIRKQAYNLMSVEPFYTYVFVLGQRENTFFLETAYDNKKGIELKWDQVYERGTRMNINAVKYYFFEGFDSLEETDFPLYAQDISRRKIILDSL